MTRPLPDSRAGRLLVRRPSPRLADGELTHLDRVPVSYETALEQWHRYVQAFEHHGWPVIEAEPEDSCPDVQFVEDTMVVCGDLAVMARPGADSRLPEIPGAERSISRLGYRIARIEPPGTLDGGDVLKLGTTMYVGVNGRTNHEGAQQLAAAVAPEGWKVVKVPISKVLHLKTSVSALPDGTLLGYLPVIDHAELLPDLTPVPEQHGWRCVILDWQTVLMSTSAPRTAELIRSLGFRTVQVDVSELEKLESSVTCLSVRLREPMEE